MTATQFDARKRPYAPRGRRLDPSAVEGVFYSRDRELLLEGPAGTGKTRGALEKVHLAMLKYPGARGLLCRKTRQSMSQTVLVTFEEKVAPEGATWVSSTQRKLRQSYLYPRASLSAPASELVVCGLDDPDRVMSAEYDIIFVAESTELTEDDHEKLTTRLRNGRMPYQQIILDCNPGAPSHWLNQRALQGKMTRFLSRHEDNPTLWDGQAWTPTGEAYMATLAGLTGHRKLRLLRGIWAAAQGVVYEGYDAAVHLVGRREIPASWRRIRAVDFGWNHPFVCQWWAVDPDGRAWMYRELYGTHRLTADWAKEIVTLSAGESIEATVCDHDREERAELEKAGIRTTAAWKPSGSINMGIQAVEARLRIAGDGRPRLFLLRDSLEQADPRLLESKRPTCTAEEFDAYTWPIAGDGRVVKETPVDKDNHGMDAMRYFVCWLDDLGQEKSAYENPDYRPCVIGG